MIFKGNFLYTPALGELTVREGEYLVVDGEKCAGFYRALPQEYAGQSVTDFGRALVLPAFCDLHLHAPQMVNRGVGYDQELLPWLETYTFPVEARYGDADFAEAAWKRFLNRMWANGTLRFSAFATIHKEAAWRLMELTERAGLSALIGKVNMDRNAPDSLREDTDASLADTEELICRSRAELKHVGYILTPRFVPSTTARLMDGLGRLGERYGLPVQSHLSENRSEIAWVGQLHPECASYTEVYRDYGLLRRGCTIMAHAVHLTGREEAILREEGVTLAHCAQSNTNLSSGVMPLRRSLSEGLRCCVASDVAGGHAAAMNRHVAATVGLSKLRALDHPEERLLSLPSTWPPRGRGNSSGRWAPSSRGTISTPWWWMWTSWMAACPAPPSRSWSSSSTTGTTGISWPATAGAPWWKSPLRNNGIKDRPGARALRGCFFRGGGRGRVPALFLYFRWETC